MTKVLVVDDEADIRELVVDTLKDVGYEVFEASNGNTALEIALQQRLDIILLDIWMPVLDGFGVLRRLKEIHETEDIPIIMLTAMSSSEGEKLAMDMGVYHYISKPWEPDVLEATIRVALRESIYISTPIGVGEKQMDDKLGGGIPIGSLALIEGASSAGKSILCQHLTFGALRNGQRVAYFSSEHTTRGLVTQMESIGMRISSDLHTRMLSVFPLEESAPDNDPQDRLKQLVRNIELLPKQYQVVTIDSITTLAGSAPEHCILEFFSSCKRLCSLGRSIIVVTHTYAFDEKMLIRLRSLCDTHLSLNIKEVGGRLAKTIEVRKIHSAEQPTGNVVSFEVEPGIGMRIMPIRAARV
jgi:archaeal flagellar protein FlaH